MELFSKEGKVKNLTFTPLSPYQSHGLASLIRFYNSVSQLRSFSFPISDSQMKERFD